MAIYRWRKSTVGWQSRITNLFTLNGDARTLFTSTTNPPQVAVTDDGSVPALSNGVYTLSRTFQLSAHLPLSGNFVAPQSPSNIMYTVNVSGDDVQYYPSDYAVMVGGYGTVKKYEAVQGPGTSQGYVYSNSSTAYPNGGVSGNYYYDQRTELSFSPVINVPPQVMQGNQITVSWTSVDGADGYILERKANTDANWTQVYSGANLSFSETVGTWTSVQYRVKAGVSGTYGDYTTSASVPVVSASIVVISGTYGDYTTSASVPVVSASIVVISGTDGDLGTLTNDVSYVVSSDGTNPLTVVETINGIARTFTAVNGATNKISVVDLPTGTGTITITASTNPGSGVVTVTRSWTYAKTAPTFAEQGGLAQLTQQGQNIWAKTIAEAVRTPGIWGGNLGLALSKLANAVLYDPKTGGFNGIGGADATIPMVSIETGSYVGTGTAGASNPNSISLSFPAKCLIVRRVSNANQYVSYGLTLLGTGQTVIEATATDNGNNRFVYVTSFSNIVRWYATTQNGNDVGDQMNIQGQTYNWIAIG